MTPVGLEAFRSNQEEAILAALDGMLSPVVAICCHSNALTPATVAAAGKDCLVIMPTGGKRGPCKTAGQVSYSLHGTHASVAYTSQAASRCAMRFQPW